MPRSERGKRLLLQITDGGKMDKLFKGQQIIPTYETENSMLVLGDTFQVLDKLKSQSVDLIFADPPYFLSNGGFTCSGGKQVSVNKGDWDAADGWPAKHRFNRRWLHRCHRILKPNGSIWISGTLHNIFSIGMALEQEGFKIINNITWQKSNPPPNLACRCFTHSTETIIWAKLNDKKAKQTFHYNLMKAENGGKQMKDVWTTSLTPPSEKTEGKHPTQKPLVILERIIKASSNAGDIVLDPFCGSSTTGVAAQKLGRKYIGVDSNNEYIDLSIRRLKKCANETLKIG